VFHCVLGSEVCVLVPRSSGTPVATWAWPTWVVSRRCVLEVVFILLEFPPPSRRIFIGSHSLPPLWFAVSVLHCVIPTTKYEQTGVGLGLHKTKSQEGRDKPTVPCTRGLLQSIQGFVETTDETGVSSPQIWRAVSSRQSQSESHGGRRSSHQVDE
jgi:hypothetical protein